MSTIDIRDLVRVAKEEGNDVVGSWTPEQAALLNGQASAPAGLGAMGIAALVRCVEEAGAPAWLIEGLWPADAYGIQGAEDKAGKTWSVDDLSVSVVTGTPWLNHFACPAPGPVLLLAGEGGARSTLRRLQAIVVGRGGTLDDLDGLRVALRVPRLTRIADLNALADEVSANPPRLIVLDPMYLSVAGVKGSDLYAMGEALGGLQAVAQEAGAALVVVVHWNKTGEGSGARRFSGVGPGAWGRVLGSAAVERRSREADGSSVVSLRWEFVGGEIGDRSFRMRRRVWAEDPSDLSSPLHYEVEVTSEETGEQAAGDDLATSERRVLTVLPDQGSAAAVREFGDLLAVDGQGPPLKRSTIQDALEQLAGLGLADAEKPGNGRRNRWWRTGA
jgi:hypothetical protein